MRMRLDLVFDVESGFTPRQPVLLGGQVLAPGARLDPKETRIHGMPLHHLVGRDLEVSSDKDGVLLVTGFHER